MLCPRAAVAAALVHFAAASSLRRHSYLTVAVSDPGQSAVLARWSR